MTYVYDLVLNFDDNLYDFFEWDKNDNYLHIKKIGVVRVESKIYNDILDNRVMFNDDFFLNIFNKCEYYDKKKVKSFPYVFLLTDTYRTMALMLDDSLKVIKYSSLLIDEEEEVNEISGRLPSVNFEYNIIEKNDINDLTRYEKKVLNYIKKDLENAYRRKNINKLKYLYYEYFNKENDDLEDIYKRLLLTLEKYNYRHNDLYKLIKLSCSEVKKNWQN